MKFPTARFHGILLENSGLGVRMLLETLTLLHSKISDTFSRPKPNFQDTNNNKKVCVWYKKIQTPISERLHLTRFHT